MIIIAFPKVVIPQKHSQEEVQDFIKDVIILCQTHDSSSSGQKDITTGLSSYSFYDIFM